MLFFLAAFATLTISAQDAFFAWAYALGVLMLAAIRGVRGAAGQFDQVPRIALTMVSLWGFGQLAFGATIYRYATLDASVRTAALLATTAVASRAFENPRLRRQFLTAFVWFGFAVSLAALLAYASSSGLVLWIFASPYPDVWGPFLSRNDFAVFLELCFPVALWLAFRGPNENLYLGVAAALLAAGIASASRAGAGLLLAEATVVPLAAKRLKDLAKFGAIAVVAILIAGPGTLVGRLRTSGDLFRYRREIARSTAQMIAAHPWRGFGIGTFAQAYPAYATFDAGARVEHAHNQWLEWAADGGIPYAFLWFTMAAALLLPAIRSVWGIGVIAVFLNASVDYPFVRFGLTAWIFALIGALVPVDMRGVPSRVHYPKEHRRATP